MIDDVDLSHTLDPIIPNGTIYYCCMRDNAKIANVKDHLKYGAFNSMINQKHHTH